MTNRCDIFFLELKNKVFFVLVAFCDENIMSWSLGARWKKCLVLRSSMSSHCFAIILGRDYLGFVGFTHYNQSSTARKINTRLRVHHS